MSQQFEKFLFRNSTQPPTNDTEAFPPVIESLVERGNIAMAADDWIAARRCYIAAYFLPGGRGATVKAKINMIEHLLEVAGLIDVASNRLDSIATAGDELPETISDLETLADQLYELRMELAHSERLMNLERLLLAATSKVKDCLG